MGRHSGAAVLAFVVCVVAAVVVLSVEEAEAANPNYAEALQKSMFFYEAQRAGRKDAQSRVHWRGDSVVNDGSDLGFDLSGGWFDAGDHIKFGVPMGYSATVLAWGGLTFRDGYVKSGQMQYLKSNLRFVAEYFLQAHSKGKFVLAGQVGVADYDHQSWVSPEVIHYAAAKTRPSQMITKNCPGSELAGEASAALASISLLLREDNATYADILLRHATELHEFADTYRGVYTACITAAAGYYDSYSGYLDELAWAGAWMYRATNNRTYLDKARDAYNQSTGGASCPCQWTLSWDDVSYGAAVVLYELTNDTLYSVNIEKNLDFWSKTLRKSAGGLSFLNQWGSLRYATTTAFTAFAYARLIAKSKPAVATAYTAWAKVQVDYALGVNPANRSYVVGFGKNYPKNPHHRGATGGWANSVTCCPTTSRHILYGALVGGPKAADDFAYADLRNDWIANEVATDYNAGFSGALSALMETYGGTALANFPVRESYTPSDEFGVSMALNGQDVAQYLGLRIIVKQMTAWPARRVQLSLRYFMNLADVEAMALVANPLDALTLSIEYADGNGKAVVSKGWLPQQVNNRTVYYLEVAWPAENAPWPGGVGSTGSEYEAQVRISLTATKRSTLWNRKTDYSYGALTSSITATELVCLYSNGALVFGREPGGDASVAPRPTTIKSTTAVTALSSSPSPAPASTLPTTSSKQALSASSSKQASSATSSKQASSATSSKQASS
eukprot:Opistho-2@89521